MTTVLCYGDIFGRPGRKAIALSLPGLIEKYNPDFILGNVENLAGGRGVNQRTYDELMNLGFSGFTSGNHIWDNKEVLGLFERERNIFRPANYPRENPGKGFGCLSQNGKSLYVVNLMGRLFMDSIDCPFHKVEQILKEIPSDASIFVDFHAEASSEKNAMGWFLDGKVGAVVGTHSHVQTADERILPRGTAYIGDIGMTGSFDSIIGMEIEPVIKKFLTKRPHSYQIAKRNLGVCCVVVSLEGKKATRIERVRYLLDQDLLENERD